MSKASSLLAFLRHHASRRSREPAIRLVSESGVLIQLNWPDLLSLCESAAARLAPMALRGPVLVRSDNSVGVLAALVGGVAAGADVLPVAPDVPASELERLLPSIRQGTVVESTESTGQRLRLCARRVALTDLPRPSSGRWVVPRREGGVLLPTSGTTGEPKLVRRCERALVAVGTACQGGFGLRRDDRILLAIPVFHSYGIDQLMAALVSGCTVDLHTRFHPAGVRRALLEDGITTFPAVPIMCDSLLRSQDTAGSRSLRRVISAGSPLPFRVFERFRNVYDISIGQLYGATEFGSVTYNDPSTRDFDPLHVGKPLPGVEIRIVDPGKPDPSSPLPAGHEGLVALKSPGLFDGYVGQSGSCLKAGFFVTGDLGVIDRGGSLRLTGRAALLVDIGGRKVNPLEVECVLSTHPGVREVVVMALRQTETVARLKAVVVPEPGARLHPESLRRFARMHMAPHKVPRVWDIRTDVPRSSTGKILRARLLCELGARAS